MPEIGILLTSEEEDSIVEFILDRGAFLVPDVHYRSQSYAQIGTIEDFTQFRADTRLFFVMHESFQITPLEVRPLEKDGRPVYFIMQRNGGPTIDFLSTTEFAEDGAQKVNPGFLAYHKTFWNPDAGENQAPPEALPAFFAQLKSLLRAQARRVKIGKRTYWVGNAMDAALRSRNKSIGINGLNADPYRNPGAEQGRRVG